METKLVQIDGYSNLNRHIESHAIINTSTNDYEAFMSKRKKDKELNQRLTNLETDMSNIKNLLSEILTCIKK